MISKHELITQYLPYGIEFYYDKLQTELVDDEYDCDVVLITDNKYLNSTFVLLESLYQTKLYDSYYNINIICIDIPIGNKAKLYRFNSKNFNINIIDKQYFYSIVNYVRHISKSALQKFNLPFIFNTKNKILYLDTDIIAFRDISHIYHLNITDYYLAAVKDRWGYFWPTRDFNKRLNINHDGYFNSGVMLLNLELLRKDKKIYDLWNYRMRHNSIYMDQDTFNVVLGERVHYMPFYFNMLSTAISNLTLDELRKFYPEIESGEWNKEGLLYHFASGNKPWNSKCLYHDIWQGYYNNIKEKIY